MDLLYGGFWNFRIKKQNKIKIPSSIWHKIYYLYQSFSGSYIGEHTEFHDIPIFPHGITGIFTSNKSIIGKNVTIFQQVTIGSNTLPSHKMQGAPIIGNNVYIGAGAKIIGKVRIGDNCRIGANCVVVKDMPPNTTAVAASTRYIKSDSTLDNTFISIKNID